MSKRLIVILEHPVGEDMLEALPGAALGRVVESHPALEPLLDYAEPDPLQIAAQIGMVYALDSDDVEDLREVNFGPLHWHEPTAGLHTVQAALSALRERPESVPAALYDPGLHPSDVIADLEALERVLHRARHTETRFHLLLTL